MREGWYEDNYLVLFEDRAESLAELYGLSQALPGYRLVGLLSWADFLVQDSRGAQYTVPTVPMLLQKLKPCHMTAAPKALRPDDRISGKVKWYLQPVVFGGDPNRGDNLAWVTLEEHTELVRWWNEKYQEVQAARGGQPAA